MRKLPRIGLRHNLKIRQRLLLIVGLAAVPTAVLLIAQFLHQSDDLNTAQRERSGVEYVLAMQKLLTATQEHQGAVSLSKVGEVAAAQRVTDTATDVDRAFAAVQREDKKYGAEFHTGNRIAAMKQKWDALNATAIAQTVTETNAAHTDLIANDMIPFMYDLGEASSLLYDADAASYHASVAIASAVPAANEALDQARAYGSSFKGTRLGSRSLQAATQPERDFMVGQVALVQSSAAGLNRELTSAIAADPKLGSRLKPLMLAADDARNQFIATIDDELNSDSAVRRDATQFFAEGTKAIDAQVAVSTASSGIIQSILSQRVNTTSQARALSTGTTLIGVAVAGLLILLVGQGITRRIGRLASVADGISLGELDAEIDVRGDDEIGELAESIRRMQSSLQAAIGRLRARRASA